MQWQQTLGFMTPRFSETWLIYEPIFCAACLQPLTKWLWMFAI